MEKLRTKFLDKLNIIYSSRELEILELGFNTTKRPTTLRVNTLKSSNKEIEEVLNKNNIKYIPIPYLDNGYMLDGSDERDIRKLSIYDDGKIYLQGISSQLIGQILSDELDGDNLNILDLTASPGGKTTHISMLVSDGGQIVANELGKIRYDKLCHNTKKLGAKNIITTNLDARDLRNHYKEGYFDIIIADMPCSREGRVNLNNEKSYKFLEKPGINKINYNLQKDILEANIGLLKKGGTLIYSTCTLDPYENEGILHLLLSNYKDLDIVDISTYFSHDDISKYTKTPLRGYKKQIYNSKVKNAIRILPNPYMEGFFIAKIKKLES